MIDWGDTPTGVDRASIYWPQVDSAEVLGAGEAALFDAPAVRRGRAHDPVHGAAGHHLHSDRGRDRRLTMPACSPWICPRA